MGRARKDENGRLSEAGFIIRPRPLKDGGTAYVLERGFSPDGKRLREQFATLGGAREAARRAALDKERMGVASKALTEAARLDAAEALKVLAPLGVTLTEAATEYRRRHGRPDHADGMTFADLARRFADWMETTPRKLGTKSPGGYRPTTIADCGGKLARLARDLGPAAAAEITPEILGEWLDAQGFHPTPWDNHRRAVGMLYTWAGRKDGPLPGIANPAAGLTPPPLAVHLPAVWPPERVEEVLRYTEAAAPELVPYLAAGFFAGCRPDELRRIGPEALDYATAEIRIPAAASKTHRERLVTMPANLLAWLEAYPPAAGKPLGPSHSTLARFRAKLRGALGFDWPKDIARHCMATYHAALHGMDATADQLGHGSTKMLRDHYRGLVANRGQAAARYFEIVPKAIAEARKGWEKLA